MSKGKGIVLLYHRVENLIRDPFRLAVHPHRFEDQLKYLKKKYNIVSLQDMVRRLSRGLSIANQVAITFDDGYADNFYCALPILEKYSVPATFFITAGMIGQGCEFWWDELERIFYSNKNLPRALSLDIKNHTYSWDTPDSKEHPVIFKNMHRLLRPLPWEKRENILDALFVWAELDRNAIRKPYRILDKDEVQLLSRNELAEIGSHSMSHIMLKSQSRVSLEEEIVGSREVLEEITGNEVNSFSYPFGGKGDISGKAVRIVKKSGYTCALSNIQGNVCQKADVFLIPRTIIRDWDTDEFKHNMDLVLG